MEVFELIHLLAVVVWVGGMFFAFMALRPAAAEALETPERLRLWDKTFRRFFRWVWLAIVLLLVTGVKMSGLFGGIFHVPGYVRLMMMDGLTMIGIYLYLFFGQYLQFRRHVAREDWAKAGKKLAMIRKLIATNLTLGMLTIGVAELGRGI